MVKAKRDGGMGFREFTAFNKALLAKQAWRALKNPDAPWVKLFKSLYFRGEDILNAKRGKKSSWGWQSFFEGVKVLNMGTRWNVNNGSNIVIWSDKWLPRDLDFKVSTPKPNETAPMLVKSLIDFERKTWKESELVKWFSEEDAKVISAIPVGAPEVKDERVWHFNLDGVYTVKSGYNIILKQTKGGANQPSSSFIRNSQLWNSIWRLKSIPKVKNFMWRACLNSLPTRENLRKRCKLEFQECQRCGDSVESLEHILFFCPFAQATWRYSSFNYSPNPIGFTSFTQWWQEIGLFFQSKNAEDQLPLVAFLCWNLWLSRNDLIFEQKKSQPHLVWEKSSRLHGEFLTANHNLDYQRHRGAAMGNDERWLPPDIGTVKLNCDASWSKEEKTCGIAVVARNNLGELIAGHQAVFKAYSVRTAEAMAIQEGLKLIQRAGWREVIIENDNQALIFSLQNQLNNCWESSAVEKNINLLSSSLNVIFGYVRRSANRVADWVARKARLGSLPCNWVEYVPLELDSLIRYDCNISR